MTSLYAFSVDIAKIGVQFVFTHCHSNLVKVLVDYSPAQTGVSCRTEFTNIPTALAGFVVLVDGALTHEDESS